MTNSSKIPKNEVSIGSNGGFIRLGLPRELNDGKQRYISLGLRDTPENRKLAEIKRAEVQKDVTAQLLGFNTFDFTYEKYTGIKRPDLTVVTDINQAPPKPNLKLGELWNMWVEHRRPTLEITSLKSVWCTYDNMLLLVQHLDLTTENAQKIYQHVIGASINQKRIINLLSQIHHAYDRALALEMVSGKNHFYGMAEDAKKIIKPHKPKSVNVEDEDIRAFSREEMVTILEFLKNSATGKKWHDFTKFRFMTGCRIGEAIALRWKHITSNCSRILFNENYSSQCRLTKATKNKTARRFPCNTELQLFLLSIRPENPDPDEIVFKSPQGKQIHSHIYYEAWTGKRDSRYKDENGNPKWYPGFIQKLKKEGKIRKALKPYATRHTFISLMIDAGMDMLVVSALCENSPDVILKHYYQRTKDPVIPTLGI